MTFLNLSVDLPYALKRFADAEGILYVKMLSDHLETRFGRDWGVLLKEVRLLARALFIVDEKDTIRYVQVIHDDLFSRPLDYVEIRSAMKSLGLLDE